VSKLFLLAGVFLAACSAPDSPQTATAVPTTAGPTAALTETIASSTWWQPESGATWQIQFNGKIDTTLEVDIYDLDLFDTSAETVAALHADGKRVICYLNAGAWEDWRPDADTFPAEVLGNDYEGWPGERWLDISNLEALAPIMLARLDLCAAKGFDGVDPDNLDGFTNDTGFELSGEDALGYTQWLAEEAHSRGLAIGLKNAPENASELEPHFDWVITESCFVYGWCADMLPFIEAGKPVFAIEYVEMGMSTASFCAEAIDLGFSAILKNRNLDAWIASC
jgi:hypothetical protein